MRSRDNGADVGRMGFTHLPVRIDDIDGRLATVTDNFANKHQVRIDVVRTGMAPKVGESWIMDRTLGYWTFAAKIGTVSASGSASGIRAATVVVAASDARLQEKLGADYVCTGTNDHLVIIQALLDLYDNGNAYGGLLLLSSGTFYFGGAVVNVNGVDIKGMGADTTFIRANGPVPFLAIDMDYGSTISDLDLGGAYSKMDIPGYNGIRLGAFAKAKDVTVGQFYDCIQMDYLKPSFIDSRVYSASRYGINAGLAWYSRIRGNDFSSCGSGITSGRPYAGYGGVYLGSPGDTFRHAGNLVEGNQFIDNVGPGVIVTNGRHNSITGNQFVGSGRYSFGIFASHIYLDNGAANTSIQANTFRQSPLSGFFSTEYCIEVASASVLDTVIQNNDMLNGAASSAMIADLGTRTIRRNNAGDDRSNPGPAFSFGGIITQVTESTRKSIVTPQRILTVFVRVGVAGSTQTTIQVMRSNAPVVTINLAAGQASFSYSLGATGVNFASGDYMSVIVSPGSGVGNLVVETFVA